MVDDYFFNMMLLVDSVIKIYKYHDYDIKLLSKQEIEYINHSNEILKIIRDLESNPNRIDELNGEFEILKSKMPLFDDECKTIEKINNSAIDSYYLGIN